MWTKLTFAILLSGILLAPAEAQYRPRYPDREPPPRYLERDVYPRDDRGAQTDEREVWRYDSFEWGGTFERVRGKMWRQYRNNMAPVSFREVNRTPEFVELYDDSRAMAVRLHDDAMYYNQYGRGWRGPHRGLWEFARQFRR